MAKETDSPMVELTQGPDPDAAPDPAPEPIPQPEPEPAPAADAAAPAAPYLDADGNAHAVLTTNCWPLLDGQIVFAAPDAIAALIASGDARAATAKDVEAARPFIHPLPPAEGSR